MQAHRSIHSPHAVNGTESRPPETTSNPDALAQALQVTQQSLAAFASLQEQTAQLHKQFLQSQEAAQRTLQLLVEQQHALLTGARPATAPTRVAALSSAPAAEPLAPKTARAATPARQDHSHRVPQPAVPKAQPVKLAEDNKSSPTLLRVAPILMAVVAEKTGYPAEMLSPEMALDADLGIDSIKRVEIFSALQERLPDAPAVKSEHLGTIHRLGDITAFLSQNVAAAQPKPAPAASNGHADSANKSAPAASNGHVHTPKQTKAVDRREDRLERSLLRTVPLKRESTPKVAIAPGSTILVVADAAPLISQLLRCIEHDGFRTRHMSWDVAPSEIMNVAGLLLVAPVDRVIDDLPLRAFRWLRHAAPGIKQAAASGGGLFATVTRIDGAFGLGHLDPKRDARQGALAGLAKTASHEWPEAACKAIDLAVEANSSANSLWEEIRIQGPLEVGVSASGKLALELIEVPAANVAHDREALSSADVVLISGGARGVTAAVAQAIAKRFKPTIVLLGRTNIDEIEPLWLRDCETEAAIKQALVRNLAPAATPRTIEEKYRQVAGRREAIRNIDSMRQAGSTVVYCSLDVTDVAAVTSALRGLKSPVTSLIHGAGVLADRRIAELTDEQFAAVYSTKVDGLAALLAALEGSSLKHIALFSSSTGRFGRTGQVAYAAANEAINKIAQQEARRRPHCKVTAINWGPWDGGMVTPALRTMFESEGVGVVSLDRGGDALLAELTADRSDVEVTVIARPAKHAPAVASSAPASSLQLAFEQQISLVNHPILGSHIVDGRPVLPFALHLEWLAQAAMHSNPGYAFHGLNDLRLLQGVVLEESGVLPLKALAGKPVRRDKEFVVPVELHGKRGSKEVVHSRAEIVLVQRLPAEEKADSPLPLDPYPHPLGDIYRRFLFHGPKLACIERIDGVSSRAIAGASRTAPTPAAWLSQPMRGVWITDPLVIDAAFQLMILWSFAEQGAGSLPCFIGRYRQYRRTFPAGLVGVAIRVTHANGSLARADVDFTDPSGGLIARIHDYECVVDAKLNRAFRRNRILEGVAAEGNGSH